MLLYVATRIPAPSPTHTSLDIGKKEDHTYFRHIDIKLIDLIANGKGKHQIPGSLSLDDEVKGGYTMIIPGMHHHAKEGLTRLQGRPRVKLNCFAHRVEGALWNRDDADKLGTG